MSTQQGLNNLATIIKRLEAATARLEDVAHHSSSSHSAPSQAGTESSQIPALGAAISSSNAAPPAAPVPEQKEEQEPPAVKAYQTDIIESALKEYLDRSSEIGGVVEEHANLISSLTTTQKAYILLASKAIKPSAQQNLQKVLEPTQACMLKINEYKDKTSRSKEGRAWGNHLSAIGEGAGAWGWVAVEPTPAPFIGEMKESAQFWLNRVIKEFKETDKKQIVWANSFVALLNALQKYVKSYHTTGMTWNPKGQDALSIKQDEASSGSPAPPPPPPAPAPAAPASSGSTAKSAPAPGPNAFLASINQGAGVTSGLKKVDPSLMTHKNPELRAAGVVPEKAAPAPPTKPKPTTLTQKKPAETKLDGTKWIVEYHENAQHVLIEETEINHTVHLFGCKNSVVQIKGKVNAISAVNCSKTSILLDSVVSGLSITSCPSFTVQITGQASTIQIDNTDSGQVYLSKDCVNTVEIITSKTSAINISVPGQEEGDYEEKPVPEQMKSVIKDGKLVTTLVEHSG